MVFVRFDLDVINQPCLPYFIALDRANNTIGEGFTSFSGYLRVYRFGFVRACAWLTRFAGQGADQHSITCGRRPMLPL